MIRPHLERFERAVDSFAYSGWSSAALWGYGAAWLISERGNIGWDGWLTLGLGEVALAIRRWQGKQK